MPNADDIIIRRLSPELLDDYLAFFDGPAFADNPEWADCYCFFPYFEDQDAFEERPAAANREAIIEAINTARADGYLAYAGGRVIGWISAGPRQRYPELADLPGDSARTGATPCFTIDPGWRRQGVARRLLAAAIEGLQKDGMARLEAGPHTAPENDAQRYRGTIEFYESAGYEKVTELPGGITLMEKELQETP